MAGVWSNTYTRQYPGVLQEERAQREQGYSQAADCFLFLSDTNSLPAQSISFHGPASVRVR